MSETKLLEYLGAPINTWKFGGDDSYYRGISYRMKKAIECKLPEDVKTCYCGKAIDINYYVYNCEKKTIKILCNSCCNRFIPSHMERLRKFIGSDFKDYEYVGGVMNKNHRDNIDYKELHLFEHPRSRKFKKRFEFKREFPAYTDRCGCGHKIIRNDYIYNKNTDEIKIVGSTCMNHWADHNKFNNCKRCGLVTRAKDNICKSCKSTTTYCPCGGKYKSNGLRHFTTDKHRNYLRSLNQV